MAPHQDKLGRNDRCHCGSGKKYKKCCLDKDQAAARQERAAEAAEKEREKDLEKAPGPGAPATAPYAEPAWEAEEDEGDAAEEETEDDAAWGEDEDEGYPKPPEIPDADPATAAFVDAWWERFMPLYRSCDLERILPMLDAVMAEHPAVVPHLALDEEFLLEFGGMMIQAGRRAELTDRLLHLRQAFPSVYDQVFGYLDRSLVALLVVANRGAEAGGLFDRFIAYPQHYSEYLEEVVDILMVANRQDDILALARGTAASYPFAPSAVGLPDLPMVAFLAGVPIFDRHDPSEEAAAEWVAACDALNLPEHHDLTVQVAKEFLEWAFGPPAPVPHRRPPPKAFLGQLCSRFWVWLHDTQGMSWSTAGFFAARLRELYFDKPLQGEEIRDPFNPAAQAIENHICGWHRQVFWIHGLHGFGLLQALFLLPDFLARESLGEEAKADRLRSTVRSLYEDVKKAVDASDSGLLLFESFPAYRFGQKQDPHPRVGDTSPPR